MSMLSHFVDVFLHINVYLHVLAQTYGIWIYPILFLVIFCETGLVVTPVLPGDSLLFAAGALAGGGSLSIAILCPLLFLAALLGDHVNYWIGRSVGPAVFTHKSRWFRQEYLLRTKKFYEEHGTTAVVLSQFVPIVRTFAPFVAGVSSMRYRTFALYNIIAVALWTLLFLGSGYFFGGIDAVQKNFEFVILGIVFVSLLPVIIGMLRSRK